jgi:hypothetical protein
VGAERGGIGAVGSGLVADGRAVLALSAGLIADCGAIGVKAVSAGTDFKQITLWVTPEEEAKVRVMLVKARAKPKASR